MNFKIEKNIPIPQKKNTDLYPFKEMEVGDSFIVPLKKANCVRTTANYNGKILNRKFKTRTEGNYLRIWRVE